MQYSRDGRVVKTFDHSAQGCGFFPGHLFRDIISGLNSPMLNTCTWIREKVCRANKIQSVGATLKGCPVYLKPPRAR